jgi:hypothetical protein
LSEPSLIMFVVSYQCPHCQSPLEGRTTRADAWLRCPHCKRASQPPDQALTPETPGPIPADTQADTKPMPLAGVAPAADAGDEPRAGAGAIVESAQPPSAWRVGYASALFVSMTLLVFSLLFQNVIGMSTFSVGALLFFLLLTRSPRY